MNFGASLRISITLDDGWNDCFLFTDLQKARHFPLRQYQILSTVCIKITRPLDL
jgi:hypothetical protein